MKIAVIGTGYVGLVSGVCLARIGHNVMCVDKDKAKISKLLQGEIPIYEPNLKEALDEVFGAGRIDFTTDLKKALNGAKAVFIAVGTPQGEDGSADLSYVLTAAKEIAQLAQDEILVINKSTVPVKTADKVRTVLAQTNPNIKFLVASNPEFLREGSALDDFMHPDRIVIGVDDEKSAQILGEIYSFFPAQKLVRTDTTTSELIKYAANSFLATKVSFINEMADLCEKVGGDVKALSRGIGLDSRIGEKFLNAGPGFGGSCFPKDILAILKIAQENGAELSLVDSVIKSNELRKKNMARRIWANLGGENAARGKKIALLGLAFKANTDDVRYSPAITIAKEILRSGVKVAAHDFEALENAKQEFVGLDGVEFFEDVYQACEGADLLVVATEWEEYKGLDLEEVGRKLKVKKIVDLRGVFDVKEARKKGFEIDFIGGGLR